ncbi:hypothetical protein [Enterobacter hormaechei]|uniref:hypothetical protein n=1 Tax=Enterobacter hormaechei TaxID=158836 RepID=UPI002874060A|nr:hypothetical protein [Enterobacter hormaechei]MDR9909388.1 hypothetical protein [Enterobacter hormaechei subsp. steigerwaltii]
MGFPSPATDYAESRLTIDKICQINGNSAVIETTTGYAVLDRSIKAKPGDLVLITLFDRLHFARVNTNGLVTDDEQNLTGEELNEIRTEGVVTFTIERTPATQAREARRSTHA